MLNRAVVITISNRCHRGERDDRSGRAIIELLPRLDAVLVHRQIVPDEVELIREAVGRWLGSAEVLLTTGGTGIGPQDVTPEALEPLIERPLPGFGEVMRGRSFDLTPLSIVSRSGAGVAKGTLVVWLPGSPKAVGECMGWIAPAIVHVCKFLRGESPH